MKETRGRHLTLSVDEGIAVVSYHNPPVNALSVEDYDTIKDLFHDLDNRNDINVAVLKTEGKGFMAGNDIRDLKTHTPESHAAYQQKLIDAFESIAQCRYPVIGAVQGYALGAGFVFAACCDILIASSDAYFALPEITLCVISGVGYALKLLPEGAARYACMTGLPLKAEELLRFGSVSKVVEREELEQEVMKAAGQIAKLPPHAVVYMKELIGQHCDHEYRKKFKLEDAYTGRLFGLPEKAEAVNAFLEKRKPDYR